MSFKNKSTGHDLLSSDSDIELHNNTDDDQGNSDSEDEPDNMTYGDQWSNDSHIDLTHSDSLYESNMKNKNYRHHDYHHGNQDTTSNQFISSHNLKRQNLLQNELLYSSENEHESLLGREQNTNNNNKIIIILVVVLVITLIALVVALLTNSETKKIQPVIGKDCGSPPTISYGFYWITGSTPGAVSFYNCTDGYHGVGVGRVLCQKDGQWSNINFVCQKDCYKPPDVSDSTYSRSGIYSFYSCHQGLYPVGESTIICQDGTWSAVNFKCSKYCGQPPNIPFSAHQFNVATYRCFSGYVPVGEPSIICNARGQWSTGHLSCLKDCSTPPTISLSTACYSSTYAGSKVVYYCKSGYTGVGNPVTTCGSDGKWTTSNFYCKYIDCGTPPNIPYSKQQIS
ncbi:hypothetical protein KUTeg_012782, partial [Tegillarca granosa]